MRGFLSIQSPPPKKIFLGDRSLDALSNKPDSRIVRTETRGSVLRRRMERLSPGIRDLHFLCDHRVRKIFKLMSPATSFQNTRWRPRHKSYDTEVARARLTANHIF